MASTKTAVCVLVGALLLAAGIFLPASPASAHYSEDAKPGDNDYLDEDCHNTSTGNADAVRSDADRKVYKGTTPSGEPIDLEEAAPKGYATHNGGITTGLRGEEGTPVDGVLEHYHATTERSYQCWLRSVLSIPRVIWILRTVGALVIAFGLLRLISSRLKIVPGAKQGSGGGLALVVGGALLVLADVLLVRIIFIITDLVEQIFETTAGLF